MLRMWRGIQYVGSKLRQFGIKLNSSLVGFLDVMVVTKGCVLGTDL